MNADLFLARVTEDFARICNAIVPRPNRMEYRPGTNMSMSLSGDNEAELAAYFENLAAGGMVTMPLGKAPWGDSFGMCTDRFGVQWLVNITGQRA